MATITWKAKPHLVMNDATPAYTIIDVPTQATPSEWEAAQLLANHYAAGDGYNGVTSVERIEEEKQ